MRFNIGDPVVYKSSSSDNNVKGIVSLVVGEHFEVTWSDGEVYSYTDWAGSCIHHRVGSPLNAIKIKLK